MTTPLTLVTSQASFDQFFLKLEWHDAFVKESHFAVAQWRGDGGMCIEQPAGTSSCEREILRVLFVLPYEANAALELVAFDTENFAMGSFLGDTYPQAMIKWRQVEVTFGPFVYIKAACIAYRFLDNKFADNNSFFAEDSVHDATGKLVEPYNIDWRTEMDLANIPNAIEG